LKIEVKLFSTLTKYLPPGSQGKKAIVEIEDGATVDDLAEKLGFGDVSCVMMVNNRQVHRAAALKEGDMVSFFPPIAGGSVKRDLSASSVGSFCATAGSTTSGLMVRGRKQFRAMRRLTKNLLRRSFNEPKVRISHAILW